VTTKGLPALDGSISYRSILNF